ncbi:2-C-methyl-D-erythritol 4-phosphate cytidylyltransferase [Fastidiosibacter lacustris]|uniref:2-C-methyl-D-erythritol 4-phosphate cytidylyltransferase n=1 Tax=Fastidiosibacter lacustris TaxID=2056695 RepID=UPI000E3409C4|nr:2-C-methyl-D-erythritol 4-phosphate cytidylyltransferase [Fastidiosibacter lacustris]
MKRIVVIPASGIGSRMQQDIPKQYIKLDNGLTILDTTISCLLSESFFDLIVVALNSKDRHWKYSIHTTNAHIKICAGGAERRDSVRNALMALKNIAKDDDWIFVHDAVRPCVRLDDIRRLYASVMVENAIGGVLALKASDTVKCVDKQQNIIKTTDRNYIYLAQTPQVFKYRTLLMGYYFCLHNDILVTDDSSVVEALDHQPIVIEGDKRNIKITTPDDLVLANYFLSTL